MDHNSSTLPPSTRRDPRVERSRAALRDALLTLLEDAPFDRITIRQVSARAGAGYATFFRHYPDKHALLNDLAADEIGELLNRALPVVFAADTRTASLALCTYVYERRRLWAALLTGGAAGVMREQFIRQARLIAPERAEPRGWLPMDLRVVFGVSGVIEIMVWWLRDQDHLSVDHVAEILDRLVITPTVTG